MILLAELSELKQIPEYLATKAIRYVESVTKDLQGECIVVETTRDVVTQKIKFCKGRTVDQIKIDSGGYIGSRFAKMYSDPTTPIETNVITTDPFVQGRGLCVQIIVGEEEFKKVCAIFQVFGFTVTPVKNEYCQIELVLNYGTNMTAITIDKNMSSSMYLMIRRAFINWIMRYPIAKNAMTEEDISVFNQFIRRDLTESDNETFFEIFFHDGTHNIDDDIEDINYLLRFFKSYTGHRATTSSLSLPLLKELLMDYDSE